ncbi:MAG: hypothetical protein IKL33_03040, partial [Alphaproteobacteria bacterium]|nr:hypothetical protein [Alphaproteobacteria bacterium]
MSGISLTSSMRSNLLSLQGTSKLMDLTQQRLSTGKKVNSAIDNPSNFYTAQSLNNRAKDLDALLDSMGQAISTIKAATEAVDSGLGLLEQAVSITEQTLSEAQMTPMPDPVKFVDNVEELRVKGYSVVDSSTTLAQFKTLLQIDNVKIVLAEDLAFTSSLNITGNNVTINGGGHQLRCNGFVVDGTDANISNIEIAGRYATTLVRANTTATGLSISNARLTNDYAGYQIGLQTYTDVSLENVS